MEVKTEANSFFEISNICRACLCDKGEMRSIFLNIEIPGTGRTMVIAEMMMAFSSVQVIIIVWNNNWNANFSIYKILVVA